MRTEGTGESHAKSTEMPVTVRAMLFATLIAALDAAANGAIGFLQDDNHFGRD